MKFQLLRLFYLAVIFMCSSCKKEFDAPPFKEVNDAARLNIKELKKRLSTQPSIFKFSTGDTNLYCTVMCDERNGNFYQQTYVRDEAGDAIQVNLKESGGLYTGDKIRINLNGVYLLFANGMLSLDSVDLTKSIVKLSSGNPVDPKPASILDIMSYNAAPINSSGFQSQLVQLNNVEFKTDTSIPTFADAIGKASVNHTLTTCTGQTLIVRTSGFASFAGKPLPKGNGSVVGIVSQYNSAMQLTIRDYNDVNMNGTLCGSLPVTATFVLGSPVTSLNETFSDVSSNVDFTRDGWINFNELGTVKWKGDVTSSNYKSVKAIAHNSGNPNNTMWLITPPIIYKNTLTLSFKSAYNYWDLNHQNALMAYVSTNFNGLNLTTANWTSISSALYANGTGPYYTGATGMKSSGIVNLNSIGILSGYTGNFCIAFKYTGNTIYNSDIYLDDIVVQ
jgi:hypothetical protein